MYVSNKCFDIQLKKKDQTWFEIFTFPFHMWIFIVGKKDLLSWVGRLSQSGLLEEAGGTKKTTNGWTLFAQLHIFAPVFLDFTQFCNLLLERPFTNVFVSLHRFASFRHPLLLAISTRLGSEIVIFVVSYYFDLALFNTTCISCQL